MAFALIVSPIRSWPVDRGSRARIATVGSVLRQRGYTVHFLLSETEGACTEAEYAAMGKQWDAVHVVPYTVDRQQQYADAWGPDDWYDFAIHEAGKALSKTWRYNLCIVNYAWCSKIFEILPPDVVRVLDTHHVFGDLHKRLFASGVRPDSYYMRIEDEATCLDRADIVLAIQEKEKSRFQCLTKRPVRNLGHYIPGAFLPARERNGTKLRGGYLASATPTNAASINALINMWDTNPYLRENAELHVGGTICGEIRSARPFLIKHGPVDNVQDYYDQLDFAVNPSIVESGLKIMSVEALSFGKPIFATADAMVGISNTYPPYVMPNIKEMTDAMSDTIAGDAQLKAATRWARETFLAYRNSQLRSLNEMLEDVRKFRLSEEREGPQI